MPFKLRNDKVCFSTRLMTTGFTKRSEVVGVKQFVTDDKPIYSAGELNALQCFYCSNKRMPPTLSTFSQRNKQILFIQFQCLKQHV